MNTETKRIYYLDILRIISCIFVLMVHVSAMYVVKNFGTFNFYVGTFFDSIGHLGVPIFIMISGALLLDKNYNYTKEKLIRHISKLILFFIFWSIIYSIVQNIIIPLQNNKNINYFKFFGEIIKGPIHLWFIQMLIGLYLIVPLLRLWVKEENKKYIEYFIILSMIFSFIIPQIISIGSNYNFFYRYIQNAIDNMNLKYIYTYVTYFVLGWYLNNYDIKDKNLLYGLGIIGLFSSFTITSILSITLNKSIDSFGYSTINAFFASIMIFLLVKNKCRKKEKSSNKIVSNIVKNTLGIYAIHQLVIIILDKYFKNVLPQNAIINIIVTFIIVAITSYTITDILRRIPLIKKVIQN